MNERYSHEIPGWMKLFGVWRINTDSIDFNWGYFAPRFGFELMLHRGSYFNQHWAISFCLIWGKVFIRLPFKTSIEESCDPPQYGIQIHNDTFWLHLGGPMDESSNQCNSKWITWYLPWFSWNFDGHHVWDGKKWVEPAKGEYEAPYSDGRIVEQHPYTYTLNNGEIQNRTATIYKERRKWHRKWFPISKKIIESIDVKFDKEVGERTGTWKGGTVGCGYDLLPNESMLSALRRMESERRFR